MLRLRSSTPWEQALESSSHSPVIINLTTIATGKTACVHMDLLNVIFISRYRQLCHNISFLVMTYKQIDFETAQTATYSPYQNYQKEPLLYLPTTVIRLEIDSLALKWDQRQIAILTQKKQWNISSICYKYHISPTFRINMIIIFFILCMI